MNIDLNKQREAMKARLKAQADAARPKPKGRGISPHARDKKVEAKGRLPHSSTFEVTYNAEGGYWHGELRVWPPDGKPAVIFTGRASGVFKLLQELDDLYREHLQEKGGQP